MQAQEKSIKGFNLLELLVVIVIAGILSAAAFPNFSSWQKERKARDAAVRVKELVTSINAQVKRGLYAYVQVYFNETDDGLEVVSKGMKMDNLSSRINDSLSTWYSPTVEKCDTTIETLMETVEEDGDDIKITRNDEGYWDDWGGITNKSEVRKIILDAATNLDNEQSGAVCFSKNGNHYYGSGDLGDAEFIPADYIIICSRLGGSNNCNIGDDGFPTGDLYAKQKKYAFKVLWTRFGDVTLEKWRQKMDGDTPGDGIFVEQ